MTIDDAIRLLQSNPKIKELKLGEQFNPDMLPKYLRDRQFQVSAWCLKHPITNTGWHEMKYVYANFDKVENHLNIIAQCDLCGNSTAIGIEV